MQRFPLGVYCRVFSGVIASTVVIAHTVLCTPEGVHTFGSCHMGVLGHGVVGDGDVDRPEDYDYEQPDDEHFPRLVASLKDETVVGVSAAESRTMMWTAAGNLYGCGSGRGLCEDELFGTRLGTRPWPKLIPAFKSVVEVALGDYHSLVRVADGAIYSYGVGGRGRLGHGDCSGRTLQVLESCRILALESKHVISMAASTASSAVCTSDGLLVTFGYGENGCLGHGTTQDEPLPRVVEALKDVAGVSLGHRHTLVYTHTGQVFSFGCSVFGNLGHANTKKIEPLPLLVKALNGQHVISVNASNCHNRACTSDRQLYT